MPDRTERARKPLPIRTAARVDVVVIGGGIAGLWLLDRLIAAGYSALLLERTALGDGQTMASQGIVHGGVKYALGNASTDASDAIAGMPARWRTHLAAGAAPDLKGVRMLAEQVLLFAEGGLGRFAAFLASHLLRGRVERCDVPPPPFDGAFRGAILGLPDFVVDVRSLLEALATPHAERIVLPVAIEGRTADGAGLVAEQAGTRFRLDCRRIVLAAGAGNEGLGRLLGVPVAMQRRPLHQVFVAGSLPWVNAHCLTGGSGVEPRLTITSQHRADGANVWSLGGAIATGGVTRSAAEQIAFARAELDRCCGFLDLPRDLAFGTLLIDRAEAPDARGRPSGVHLAQHGDVHVGWPTKLSLAPVLADRLLADLAASGFAPASTTFCDLPAGDVRVARAIADTLAWA